MAPCSVHINANREGNAANDNWLDFPGWRDAEWHHVAVTWEQASGETSLYLDGQPQVPFWVSSKGAVTAEDPALGGVDRRIAAGTLRAPSGSLVLGHKQEGYGSGFSAMHGLTGALANVRVWGRALRQAEVAAGMYVNDPPTRDRLALAFSFDPANVQVEPERGIALVRDSTSQGNDLYLGGAAPSWVYSTAPLVAPDGAPVAGPTPGAAGHALRLSDQQVLIHRGPFIDFPAVRRDCCRRRAWRVLAHRCLANGPAFQAF